MKRRTLILFLSLIFLRSAYSQDTCDLRISLLTCGPGEELYSTFGHTAIRVQERSTGNDYVFNYGTFEFGPDFYTKFMRGSLLYFLSVEDFNSFLQQYQIESRTVQEQVLLLTCDEKTRLLNALDINALPANRYYRYDFLYDNCTTRAKDIIVKNVDPPVIFKNILPADIPTFRQLIHSYLNAKQEYWSKLGIDILLGARIDKKVTNEQAMFLPDYLLQGFDNAFDGNHRLALKPVTILSMPVIASTSVIFSPFVIFSFILLAVIFISKIRSGWSSRVMSVFDFILFLASGASGLLILLMWFGRVDNVCSNNYNILWALPTNIPVAFVIYKNKSWVRKYATVVLWISIILLLSWYFLPQQLNNALLPILLLTIFRCWKISKPNYYGTQNNLISK